MTPRDPASPAEQVRAIADELASDSYDPVEIAERAEEMAEHLRAAATRIEQLEQRNAELEACLRESFNADLAQAFPAEFPSPPAAPAPPETEE